MIHLLINVIQFHEIDDDIKVARSGVSEMTDLKKKKNP